MHLDAEVADPVSPALIAEHVTPTAAAETFAGGINKLAI